LRYTVFIEIVRTGKRATFELGQFALDERAVGLLADPYDAVVAFADNVHGLVHLANVQLNVRVLLKESREGGQQEMAGLRAVNIDAQQT
jgi:hypothetical protein